MSRFLGTFDIPGTTTWLFSNNLQSCLRCVTNSIVDALPYDQIFFDFQVFSEKRQIGRFTWIPCPSFRLRPNISA